MKKFKQSLALLLAAFMLVGLVPSELVHAEEADTQVAEETEETADAVVSDDSDIINVPGVGEVQILSEEETQKYLIDSEDSEDSEEAQTADYDGFVDELPEIVVESGAAVINGYPVSDDNTIYGIPVDEIDWDDPETYKWLNNLAAEAGDIPALGSTPDDFDDIDHGDKKTSSVKIRKGIDVSKHNGDIDWEKVEKDGIYFAFIRVGYTGTEKFSLNEDSKWKDNFDDARDEGIKVGAYYFSQATSTSEAKKEATKALDILGSRYKKMDLPLAMDYEYYNSSSRLYKADLSDSERTAIVNAFYDEVQDYLDSDANSVLYASYSLLVDDLNASSIDADIWIARYRETTGYDGDYTYWQFSSKGDIDGISGDVDLDVWYDGGNTLTFNANGGTCSKSSKTITKGKELGTLPIPTRKGYVFNGWMRTKNDIDTLITSSDVAGEDGVPSKSFTVYAMWLEQQITTTVDIFDANNKSLLAEDGFVMKIESGSGIRALYIDKNAIKNSAYTFYVHRTATYVTLKDEDYAKMTGECEEITDISDLTFGWSSNNTSVATISGKTGNSTKVTVAKGATGAGNIQGRYDNPKKSGSDVEIYIVDYTPVLAATKVTLNKNKEVPGKVKAFSAYGNTINSVSITDNSKFTASYDADTQYISFGMESGVAEGSYTVTLQFNTNEGVYTKSITLVVSNTLLTAKDVNINQSTAFDLFFSDSVALLNATGSSTNIDHITSSGNQTFTVTDYGNGYALVEFKNKDNPSYGYVSGKPDTKLTFDVYFEGYTVPIQKTITLKTKTSTVKGSLSRKSTVFTPYGEGASSQALSVSFSGRVATSGDVEVYVSAADEKYVDIDGTGDSFTLTPKVSGGLFYNGKNSANITIYARDTSWASPVAIKHKISYSDKLPTIKLGKSNGAIYTGLGNCVATPLTANVNDLPELEYDIDYPVDKTAAEAEKIDVSVEDGVVYARVASGSSLPVKGSYKFAITPKLADGTALKTLKLTVKVLEGTPAIKLAKAQVSVNTNVVVTTSSALDVQSLTISSIPDGVEITGIEAVDTGKSTLAASGAVTFTYNNDTGKIDVEVDAEGTKGSDKLQLYPTVYCEESGEYVTLSPTTVTVKRVCTDPVLNISGSGKYDIVNRNNGVTYTIKNAKNMVLDPSDITALSLDGNDEDMFELEYWYYDSAKKCVYAYVCPDSDAVFSTTQTYTFNICAETSKGVEISSKNISTKVTQTSCKAVVSGDTTIQQEAKGAKEELQIRITSPDGHPISSVEVKESSLPGALAKGTNLDSLTDEDITYNADGSATINYTLTRTSYLIKGSSYSFNIFVVPEGAAVNSVKEDGVYVDKTVGTTISCTIKVAK